MGSNNCARCDVCYDLEFGLARTANHGCNGPYGNDQNIEKGDDGSMLLFIASNLVRARVKYCVFCALITHVDSFPGRTHLLRLNLGRTPIIDMDSAMRRRRYEIYRPTYFASELNENPVELQVSELSPIKHIPERPEISSRPLSERALAFIRTCIETCACKHSECQQDISHPPKRLIHIQDSEAAFVKVIETPPCFRKPYIALSYCWGQGVCLKTTQSNILDMMTGIACSNLPSIISDAIKITSMLGFNYIWVDSLCIIQDNLQDWEEESARMCSIYEGAYLTIAASSAESANVSLAQRHKRHEPKIFQWRQTSGSAAENKASNRIQLAVREESEYGFHNEDAARRLEREPLHDRGWTLQEAILSTRVVFYTPTEVQWQCLAVQTCECQTPPPTKPSVIMTRAHMGRHQGKPRELREIFAAWDRIVETYTERLLTNPDDKLPALSGLAQLVHKSLSAARGADDVNSNDGRLIPRQVEYIAGLWSDDLIRAMLWVPRQMTVQLPSKPSQTTNNTSPAGVDNTLSTSPKNEDNSYYRAPSFSWASVDGPVIYWSRNSELPSDDIAYAETARIVDVWSQPAGVGAYGRLTSAGNPQIRCGCRAGVVIRAPLIEDCTLIWNTSRNMHNSPWTLREIEPLWDTVWLDTGFVKPFRVGDVSVFGAGKQGNDKGQLIGVMPSWSVRRAHGSRTDAEEGVDMGGVCLVMMAQSTRVQRFLLLGISPSDPDVFERLGMVTISRVSGGGDLVRLPTGTRLHGNGLAPKDEHWTGKGGVASRMRTITIV